MCTRESLHVLTNQNQQRPIYSVSSRERKPSLSSKNIMMISWWVAGGGGEYCYPPPPKGVGMSTKRMVGLEQYTENSL